MRRFEIPIDVCIPVYRPGKGFPHLLSDLQEQTLPPTRILLLITENEKAVYPDFSLYPSVETFPIKADAFDHGGTRNRGMELATAPLVLFLTEDVRIRDERFLEKMAKGFFDESVAVSYARQKAYPKASLLEKCSREFNYPNQSVKKTEKDISTLGIKAFFCSDVAAMYRRDVFLSLGGFVSPVIFNEDMIFGWTALRGGYTIYYNADAAVFHSHASTGKELFKRNFDLGVSQSEHPEVFQSVSSEKEGMGLVKYVCRRLWKEKKIHLLPKFIYQSGMKYLGYRKGKNHERLSRNTILKYTTNPRYWLRLWNHRA